MNKPTILDASKISLEEIKNQYAVDAVLDTYLEQLDDLFLIRNPKHKYIKEYKEPFKEFLNDHCKGKDLSGCGNWVYFPWSKMLVHYFDEPTLLEVRTARNKNFILNEEQQKFYNFSVGVAGLSVGSHGALTVVLMGGAKKIKLADPDTISPTNLNRLRFDFTAIGKNKAELIAQYIYQLNPYSEITIFPEGINEQNQLEFLDGLDILVEELDDIEVKVNLRMEAKKRKTPVIMATDNGDNVIMDIERFDINPDAPIFYGKLDGINLKEVKQNPQKMYEAMAKIIDVTLVPKRIMHSVREVGRTIYSWPQVATAATLSGAVLAYVIKKIALGEKIVSGKTEVSLDRVFDPDYDTNEKERFEEAKNFLKELGIS